MGTRSLTTVNDGNKEILCMYRQFDGYPTGHGADLKKAFEGFTITNGISGNAEKTANGAGCLAAQVVYHFKKEDEDTHHKSGGGAQVGNIYLYAPETREVGEEYVYALRVKPDPKKRIDRIWLELFEGEVAYFGLPGSKPDDMVWLYSGWLDDFNPGDTTQVHHAKMAEPKKAAPKKPVIVAVNKGGDHRTGSLNSSITVAQINKVLGFKPNIDDDDSKVKYSWGFTVNGKRAAIWDYKGSRWSIYDPDGVVLGLFVGVLPKA